MRVIFPRRSLAFAALSLALVLNLSCGGDDGGGTPTPTPTDLLVTPGSDTLLALGETQAFVASVLDANGDPIDDATVTWSSTEPTIVSVDPSTGVATALANGSAQILATSGTLQSGAPVYVAQVPTTVTITPATANFTFVGDTQTFSATVLDAGGAPVVPVQKIWTINDNAVAVIDSNGLARGKGAGLAMVTVVAIGPGGAKAAFAAVTAVQPVASIHLRNQPTDVVAGEALDPAIQVEVRDSGGTVIAGYTGAITIGIDSGPVGPILRGTKTVNAVSGVASFSGLSLERTGAHRLSATATSLAPATTGPILVTPALPHHLDISTHPTSPPAGQPLGLVAVTEDRFGNASPDSTIPVTMELTHSLIPTDLLGDPHGINHPDGSVTFAFAYLGPSTTGYRVRVVAPGLLPDTSNAFSISHGVPYRLRFSQDSGILVAFPDGAPSLTIESVDQFDNVTYGTTIPVTLSVRWPYVAPAGKGQRVLPSDTLQVTGALIEGGLMYTRPGETSLIASSPGLIADTGGAWPAHFQNSYGAYLGPAQTCVDVEYCTGANDHGELGVDPAVLAGDSIFINADSASLTINMWSFGGSGACAVDIILGVLTKTVMCRGGNDEGQLGRGTSGPADERWVRITGASGWWEVASGQAHTCALAADSTAICWGRNDHGQLGRGSVSPFEATPAAVNGGDKFTLIRAGGDHTCGITLTNGILCWGANGDGQLGDSTIVDASAPVAVVGTNVWAEVAVGAAFTCAVKTNLGRKTLCWGNNTTGQLGDAGAGAGRIYPALVSGGLNDITFGLVAGSGHACTFANVSFICWGDDSRGQVGNGPGTGIVHAPAAVSFPSEWIPYSLAAGGEHTCALGYNPDNFPQTQVLFCWGANDRGQLGTGNLMDQTGPAPAVQ